MDMTISKWGNSLAVRIPAAVAKAAERGGWGRQYIYPPIRGASQLLEPVQYDLNSLLSGITKENRHQAIETGPATGKRYGEGCAQACLLCSGTRRIDMARFRSAGRA